jgi:molybdenum cofactor cytidylyltransferase
VVDAFRARDAPVVRAVHAGEHGHPVLFARRVFADLFAAPLPEGARSVVHARAAELEEVEVSSPALLLDVDTPDDYRRLLAEHDRGPG